MAGTIEKLQTFNSLIRTVLALTAFGGLGVAGWYGYTTYNAAEIESQRKDAALQVKEREKTTQGRGRSRNWRPKTPNWPARKRNHRAEDRN